MIKVRKAEIDYCQCNSCGSTVDVCVIILGDPEMTATQSLGLCKECRLALNASLCEYDETQIPPTTN